jgi:hypothetical protein
VNPVAMRKSLFDQLDYKVHRAYATISSCATFFSRSGANFILTLRFFANQLTSKIRLDNESLVQYIMELGEKVKKPESSAFPPSGREVLEPK